MLELIKKSILAGLGAAVVTKEKIQEATFSLVQQGKISVEEAEKLSEELIKNGRHEWEEVQRKITENVKKAMDSLDMSSQSEFQEVITRLENLEKRVAQLESAKLQNQ